MQLSCGHYAQWMAFNGPIYNLQDIASEQQRRGIIKNITGLRMIMRAAISYMSKFVRRGRMNARRCAWRKISTNPLGWLEGNWAGKSDVDAKLSTSLFRRKLPSVWMHSCSLHTLWADTLWYIYPLWRDVSSQWYFTVILIPCVSCFTF